ncbi:MAG: Fe2+-dependent dioxygenase, partial [Synechococcaceae cyanobacterium]|nr:Fe2+-dependent dioxygenase [Synechococcaceae cyanobacterium]
MRFTLEPLLSDTEVEGFRRRLLGQEARWEAGAQTAGWHARGVKENLQLARSSPLHRQLADELGAALVRHPLVQAAALPVRVHGMLFSRSGPGQGYGRHVDNAFMAEGRSDLSFTVFLCDPEAYEGGGLILESPAGEEEVRLPAGQALVYPSTLLHRVETVRAGERLVAVGWIQSRIRSAERRELLFELDTARRTLFRREGKGEVFDLISRSYT